MPRDKTRRIRSQKHRRSRQFIQLPKPVHRRCATEIPSAPLFPSSNPRIQLRPKKTPRRNPIHANSLRRPTSIASDFRQRSYRRLARPNMPATSCSATNESDRGNINDAPRTSARSCAAQKTRPSSQRSVQVRIQKWPVPLLLLGTCSVGVRPSSAQAQFTKISTLPNSASHRRKPISRCSPRPSHRKVCAQRPSAERLHVPPPPCAPNSARRPGSHNISPRPAPTPYSAARPNPTRPPQ